MPKKFEKDAIVVANKILDLGNQSIARVEQELNISMFPRNKIACPKREIQKFVPAKNLIQHPIKLTIHTM